ncbi:hypothetical protein RND81_07G051100 [Saponaria officinalis]
MAEQKRHHFITTFTIILFVISFTLIFFVFLSTENNTLTSILSPSLYRDLFSLSSKDPNFINNHNININVNNTQKTPISKDSNFSDVNGDIRGIQGVPISENVENNTGFVPVFHSPFKNSNFNDDINHTQKTPISKDSNFSDVIDDIKRIPGVPISENVDNNTGFVPNFDSEYKNSNFNDQNLGNETEIVSVEKNKDMGFVDEHVVDDGLVAKFEEEKNVRKNCDLFMGKWVRSDEYPIYKPGSCPYVDEAFDCQSNGRPDFEYLKWRWKPNDCDLPRFNATDFLVRLRGKRLMLVGDSMNRNQFESMLCVLREGLHDKSKMYEVHGYKITKGRGFYIFKFVDFNCTIEFIRSHFLVKEGTRVNGQGNSNPTLSIDKIDKTARKWKRADILVFNTGHWWTHGKTSRG